MSMGNENQFQFASGGLVEHESFYFHPDADYDIMIPQEQIKKHTSSLREVADMLANLIDRDIESDHFDVSL